MPPLTKREFFAAAVLAGLLASSKNAAFILGQLENGLSREQIAGQLAQMACTYADALIVHTQQHDAT